MNKYGNIKACYNGHTFASKKERDRYCELLLLESDGQIRNLALQPRYLLIPETPGERACTYTADFWYMENGRIVVEDVKSEATSKDKAYIVKRKLFKYQNPGIEFREA